MYKKFQGKQIGCLNIPLGRDFGLVVFSPIPLPLPLTLKIGDLLSFLCLGSRYGT